MGRSSGGCGCPPEAEEGKDEGEEWQASRDDGQKLPRGATLGGGAWKQEGSVQEPEPSSGSLGGTAGCFSPAAGGPRRPWTLTAVPLPSRTL